MIRAVIKHWLTESDNETHDLTKMLALLAVLTALGLAIYSTAWLKQPFSMQDYGTGIGVLFGGLGVALGFKKESGEGK